MTGTYDQWLILEIWTPFLKAPMGLSLRQGSNLTLLVTSTKQGRDPSSGPPKETTNSWKWISKFLSYLDWQINSGLFNGPIMTHTQILVNRWDPEQGFWHCITDGLDQSLVSSVAQANHQPYQEF